MKALVRRRRDAKRRDAPKDPYREGERAKDGEVQTGFGLGFASGGFVGGFVVESFLEEVETEADDAADGDGEKDGAGEAGAHAVGASEDDRDAAGGR